MTSKNLVLSLFIFLLSAHTSSFSQNKHAIVIHGGAGVMDRSKMSEKVQKEYIEVLEKAIRIGDSILSNGGECIDAVEQTIIILENSPLFNAGKGAVLTSEGLAELDASIMLGKTLEAGAISAVKDIKNPIKAARLVMEKSEHVMLNGKGASEFAKENRLEIVKNSYFVTEKRKQSLIDLQKKQREKTINDKHGTVGCVALDKNGNIAAGTSTGGMMNKKYGRIGDSPIIGAGTYADNNTGGFSCTGHGEYYIRLGFARDISAMIEYKNISLQEACKAEIEKLTKLGGTGGVIGLNKEGEISMEFNTTGMFRAYKKSGEEKFVAIFK